MKEFLLLRLKDVVHVKVSITAHITTTFLSIFFLPIFSSPADFMIAMSAPGTVIFNAKDGFDEDIWDDSALIRQYDRALQSSR